MRLTPVLLYLLCILSFASAQESEKTDLLFECKPFYPERAEYPEVSVKSDTVVFKLFYVDDVCSGFTYRFSQKDNTFLVQRITTPPDTCTVNEQILYGVDGFIANVPNGKYLFELQTGITENNLQSIFREVVKVRKKT